MKECRKKIGKRVEEKMKKQLLLIWLTLFFISSIGTSTVLYSQDEGIGNVVFLSGICFVKPANQVYLPLKMGNVIRSSDTIKTDPESSVEIKLYSGNRILIEGDTVLRIESSLLEKNSYTSIGLLVGRIQLLVSKLTPNKEVFNVNTLATVAGIRGTKFSVSSAEDGTTLIEVSEGIVQAETDSETYTLSKGTISEIYITGEKKDLKKRPNYMKWREKIIERIRKNPEAALLKIFQIEKKLIERLREKKGDIERYRKSWILFVKKVNQLERKGMYEEEKKLIQRQIIQTRKALTFFTRVRQNLQRLRAVMVLTARIEKEVGKPRREKLKTLVMIRKEYNKITFLIKKIEDAEAKLKKALVILNRKYRQVQQKSSAL